MAIIYSYPKVTSPLATDVLVLTDTTLTAGKRKNKTKSLAMSDLAAYVVSSTSGITGSGTLNTIPLFTPSGVKLGDSIIAQNIAGNGIAVTGSATAESLIITGSTSLGGALTVQGASTFSNVSFQGVVFDGGGNPGTAGQVLSSTGAGGDTEWINNTDANTTFDLSGATSNVNEYAIALSGSDGSLDEVNLIPGSNITLTPSATGVIIDAADSDINGSGTANSVPKWIDADTLADSIIVDNGSGVKIGGGSAQSGFLLDIGGQSVTRGNAHLQGRLQFFNTSPAYISNTADIAIEVNASEKMRITAGGKVGIGTTSPLRKLSVISSSIVSSEFKGSSAGHLIDISNSNASPTYNGIRFQHNNTFKMGVTHIADGTTKGYVQIGNGYATGSEILVVDGRTSNVGIGTTSPGAKLHVDNSNVASTTVRIDGGATADAIVAYGNGGNKYFELGEVGSDDPATLSLFKNEVNTIRLKTNGDSYFNGGNVGIGTTSPGAKLDVAGNIRINSVGQELQFSNDNVGAYRDGSNRLMISGYGGIRFQAEAVAGMENQATRMVINPSGNVGVGTASPIYELDVAGEGRFTGVLRCLSLVQTSQTDKKEGIQNIDKTKAKAIQFKEYRYKEDRTSRKRYGVLAEDLEKEYPELVYTGSDGVKGISYTDLLIKRVAELEQELEQISVDGLNENVFVDNHSKFIGIGTTKPEAKLDVVGDLKMKDDYRLPPYLTMSSERKDLFINKDLNNTVFFGDTEQPSTTNISVAADIESRGGGLVLTSPKGLKFKITVDDKGELRSIGVAPPDKR